MTKNKLSPERMLQPVNKYSLGFEDQEGNAVVCPVCGFEYVHLDLDGVKPVDHFGSNGGLKIPMFCEDGHHWDLVLDQHKGLCFMTITNAHIVEPVAEEDWK